MPPIKPSQVDKTKFIPEFVFDAFNELIVKHYIQGVARINLQEVKRLIKSKIENGREIESWWLNVEDAYEESGWEVLFHKPSYDESGDAYFCFKGQK